MPKTSVNIGVSLQNRGALFLESYYGLDRLVEAARLADVLGFGSVWLHDSMFAKPRYEPLVCMASIASVTSRVRLCTGILQPAIRNPVWLALQLATLDNLSSGRVFLGMGLGSGPRRLLEKEYEAVGSKIKDRGRIYEETIEVLEKLWTQKVVNYDGAFVKLKDVSLPYKPLQKPYPPLYMTAMYYPKDPNAFIYRKLGVRRDPERQNGLLRRAARLADGILSAWIMPHEYEQLLDQFRLYAREFKKSPSKVGGGLNVWINVNPSKSAAEAEAKWTLEQYHREKIDRESLDRWCIYGPADACAKRLQEYVSAGVRTFHLVIGSKDQLGQISRIANDILPSF